MINLKKKKIGILIPAYNEEKYIEGVAAACMLHKMDIIIVDANKTAQLKTGWSRKATNKREVNKYD